MRGEGSRPPEQLRSTGRIVGRRQAARRSDCGKAARNNDDEKNTKHFSDFNCIK